MGVELAPALAVPGSFDRRHAGLGETLAEVRLEPVRELVLGPAAELRAARTL